MKYKFARVKLGTDIRITRNYYVELLREDDHKTYKINHNNALRKANSRPFDKCNLKRQNHLILSKLGSVERPEAKLLL